MLLSNRFLSSMVEMILIIVSLAYYYPDGTTPRVSGSMSSTTMSITLVTIMEIYSVQAKPITFGETQIIGLIPGL